MLSPVASHAEPTHMECTMCRKHFTEPKLLPCGHLLCRQCLVTRLNTLPEAKCPLCQCAIVDPKERKSGQSSEDVADSFPTELAMAALIEADRLLSKPHLCCVCFSEAVTMCFNCDDMLCQSCTTVHSGLRVSKHHKVGDLTSLTAETVAANRSATCEVHDDELSKVYCPTHGASICLLCATTDHRHCPDVTKLEVKMEEASAVLAELAATLSARETELGRAISKLDQHLSEIEAREQAAVVEIGATCDRLESAVKACRRRMKKLAKSSNSGVRIVVRDEKTALSQRQERVISHKHVIHRIQGVPTHGSFGPMSTVMSTRVRDLDCNAAVLPTKVSDISMVTLTIDQQAVSRIEKELSQLGQVKVTSSQDAFIKVRFCVKNIGTPLLRPS